MEHGAMRRLIVLSALALAVAGAAGTGSGGPEPLGVTHGVASGDVTAQSAVIWARASAPAVMHVQYDTDAGFLSPREAGPVPVAEDTDFTGQVRLDELEPATRYHYRIWFSGSDGPSEAAPGTFTTAPAPDAARAVSFVVGGDLGGQRYCRRAGVGYAIFSAMAGLAPDFFVANGDMIYADGDCPAAGPDGWSNIPGDFLSVADPSVDWTNVAALREIYRRHWRYNRADPHLQAFLRQVPMYAQWDDHEVINDFGASWDHWNVLAAQRLGFQNLVAVGRETLFHYSPIARDPGDPARIYRAVRWGQDLELFIVDARSYRSRNDLADTPQNAKTLLGPGQLAWLEQGLAASTATWKVVSIDVPLSIPTGGNAAVFGRDAWANGTAPDFSAQTGFERELLGLARVLDARNVKNLVFVVTDVHFAATIRYAVDADADGDQLVFHELVTGPLNAVRGPAPTQAMLDPTLGPTLLFGDGPLFNFGYVRIARAADGRVHLIADVRDETGAPRAGSHLDLAAE
jgi:alkaline phosphatase D